MNTQYHAGNEDLLRKLQVSNQFMSKPMPAQVPGEVFFGHQAGDSSVYVLSQKKLDMMAKLALENYLRPHKAAFHLVGESDVERIKNRISTDKAEVSNTDAESMFDELFDIAVNAGASDIHIFTYKDDPHIQLRINGELERVRLSEGMTHLGLKRLCMSIYQSKTGNTASSKNSYSPTKTQSATVQEKISSCNKRNRLRYQDAELDGDEDSIHVTMRLIDLDKNFTEMELTDLGYEKDQRDLIQDVMLKGGGGLFILVGATGDGKTTTAATILGKLVKEHGGRKNIVTVEDPVEFRIPGVRHTQVTAVDGETTQEAWVRHLAAMMRRDPDYILQGEMRTPDTAHSACEAALTGHTTLVTLHGNSTFDAFSRLVELGVPLSLLGTSGFLKGIVYQRLMPVLCDKCSIKYAPDLAQRGMCSPGLMSRINIACSSLKHNLRFRNYEGCEHCRKGLKGRTACIEPLRMDHEVRKQIAEGKIDSARVEWLSKRGEGSVFDAEKTISENYPQHCVGFTAFDHAFKKMLMGMISPVDVEDKLEILTHNMIASDNQIIGEEVRMMTGSTTEDSREWAQD
ncbi:ATPase, T2SS/T4P/T4SS family [uncultured Amphritea sp.]|uniref:GspE/PulE family protein n=1 Tax=uncultured Amphritea sp. TaxID=981605 RepID=UPI002624E64F|nr:ATPase, T2SS/T4P/T4SS family [uncultured Amphritea sp.]